MQQLGISKIEVSDGIKFLECVNDDNYKNHPNIIYFLGDRYVKVCGFRDASIILYTVRL